MQMDPATSLRVRAVLGFAFSSVDFGSPGSSISLRLHGRLGLPIPALKMGEPGFSVPSRSLAYMGSVPFTFGLVRFGSLFTLSVVDVCNVGSSISVRSWARLGSALSVCEMLHMGSSAPLRSFARFDLPLSVKGEVKPSSTLSTNAEPVYLDKTLSVRGMVRFGSGLSLAGVLKVKGDSATASPQTRFTADTTYMLEENSLLKFFTGGAHTMTGENDGGILHGSWTVPANLVPSDRRLKRDITPLKRTLRAAMVDKTLATQGPPSADVSTALATRMSAPAPAAAEGSAPMWVLRQLRPVSYSFRKGAESKHMRFGFIADELESVVPQVVRRMGDRQVVDEKAVMYQDLISLLTSCLQEQTQKVEDLERSFEELRQEAAELLEDEDYVDLQNSSTNSTDLNRTVVV
eukprot:TRINITY_DN23750_c0_g1_i7.p2 TRINITY_DN23750_c0_g1~~TRINITY_DN23750_c0_g1_i7.p2  ORF type:complete len:405 (-),score=90.30 TRINITY_DN23750_c0_g1_i7:773-1987(-)